MELAVPGTLVTVGSRPIVCRAAGKVGWLATSSLSGMLGWSFGVLTVDERIRGSSSEVAMSTCAL